MFPIKVTGDDTHEKLFQTHQKYQKGDQLKVQESKYYLLPIALAQIKVCNASENVLNKIRQIIYSLYHGKEVTRKVYNNIKY